MAGKRMNKGAEAVMEVDLIFKIAAIGILVAVLNQVLSRAGRDEQATLVTVSGIVVVFLMLVGEIGELFATVREICRSAQMP